MSAATSIQKIIATIASTPEVGTSSSSKKSSFSLSFTRRKKKESSHDINRTAQLTTSSMSDISNSRKDGILESPEQQCQSEEEMKMSPILSQNKLRYSCSPSSSFSNSARRNIKTLLNHNENCTSSSSTHTNGTKNNAGYNESCIIDLSHEEYQSEGLHLPRATPYFNMSSRSPDSRKMDVPRPSWQANDCINIDDEIDDEIEDSDDDASYRQPIIDHEDVLVDTDDEEDLAPNEDPLPPKTKSRKSKSIDSFFQPTRNRLRSHSSSTAKPQPQKIPLSNFVQVHDTNTWFRENTTQSPSSSTKRPNKSYARSDIQGGSGVGLGGTIVLQEPEQEDDDECVLVLPPPPPTRTTRGRKKKSATATTRKKKPKADTAQAAPKTKKKYNYAARNRFGRGGGKKQNQSRQRQPPKSNRSSWSNYESGVGQYHGNNSNQQQQQYSISKQDPELGAFGGARLIFN